VWCAPDAVLRLPCAADAWPPQQALMFKDSSLGFAAQIKTIFRHTKRLAD
jgi:hypothetical protein